MISFRTHRRTTVGRAVMVLLVLAACKSREVTGPNLVPASLAKVNGDAQTGTVGTTLPLPLRVRVRDAGGTPVRNARVQWEAGSGAGSIQPSVSFTNSQGETVAQWTLGPIAGTALATAQVGGVDPTVFSATALPGSVARVVSLPDAVSMGVGDTLRIRSTARDQFGNDVPGQAITYSTADPAIVSVNGTGLVTATALGAARVIATSGQRADTSFISVLAAGASPCGTTTPSLLAVGEVLLPVGATNGARACLVAPEDATADYGMVLVSAAQSFGNTLVADVYGVGVRAPTAPALIAAASLSGDVPLVQQMQLSLDHPSIIDRAAELRRRMLERRALAGLTEIAREKYRATEGVAAAMQPKVARVGDLLRLNANALAACESAVMRTGRVAAVGTKSIVVTDTGNPAGGYTDAEYATIAATFDTLIYPMGTEAFGTPTDISGYGKIILFYTRAVNALTPPGAGYVIGGFFFARDLYPKTARSGLPACPSSNEAEMFYLLVPDPNATINGNRRTKDDVSKLNIGTIGHEFQHLINSSRRLYINSGAVLAEETWLDEGLSHIAEELLYLRLAGYTTRQNLGNVDVSGTTAKSTTFSNYGIQNFSRFYEYLRNPEVNSPYAPNDSLATRGAIWSFMRYSSTRLPVSGEADFFRRMANSTTAGLPNLVANLPAGQLGNYLRDWSLANLADDYSASVMASLQPQYTFPTWNFRSIFPTLRIGGQQLTSYPLSTRSLFNNVPQRIHLAGGATSYIRFSVPAGTTGLVSLSSNGGALPTTSRVGVVRLR